MPYGLKRQAQEQTKNGQHENKWEECSQGTKSETSLPSKAASTSENRKLTSGSKKAGIGGRGTMIAHQHVNIVDKTWHELTVQEEDTLDTDNFVSVWKFGGQTQFFPTHHLFLDAEPINLIVMDISKPLKQTLNQRFANGFPITHGQFLHYWLNSLHQKALEQGTKPSIAIILTHRDIIPIEDEKYIERYMNALLESLDEEPYSGCISKRNIHVVDNKHGDLGEVKHQIFQMVKAQKSWGKKIPIKWLNLETDILEKRQNGTYYIPLSAVKHSALKYDMTGEDVELFLEFHNTIGDFIHYNDPALRDVVITDPQWLIDVFKTLITPTEFLDNRDLEDEVRSQWKQGIVYEETLAGICQDVHFLVDLLKKFSLIIELPEKEYESKEGAEGIAEDEKKRKKYLIPCMLPHEDKESTRKKEIFDSVVMVYNANYKGSKLGIMQIGTFHKLVCRCVKESNWSLCTDYLTYSEAAFEITGGAKVVFTLLRAEIRASLWVSNDPGNSLIINSIRSCRMVLYRLMAQLSMDDPTWFLVLCPHTLRLSSLGVEHMEDPCYVRIINKADGQEQFQVQSDACMFHNTHPLYEDFQWMVVDKKQWVQSDPNQSAEEKPFKTIDELPSKTISKPPFQTIDEPPSNVTDETRPKTMDGQLSQITDEPPSQTIDKPLSQTIDKPSSKTIDGPPFRITDKTRSKTMDGPPSQIITDEPPFQTSDESLSHTIDKPPFKTTDEPPSNAIDEPPSQTIDEPLSQTMDETPSKSIDKPSSRIIDEPPSKTINETPSKTMDGPPSQAIDEPSSQTCDKPPSKTIDELPSQSIDEQPKTIDKPPSRTINEPPSHTIDRSPSKALDEPLSTGKQLLKTSEKINCRPCYNLLEFDTRVFIMDRLRNYPGSAMVTVKLFILCGTNVVEHFREVSFSFWYFVIT